MAAYLGVDIGGLAGKAIDDPHAAVAVDVAALRVDPRIVDVSVTGLVYDVSNGLITAITTA